MILSWLGYSRNRNVAVPYCFNFVDSSSLLGDLIESLMKTRSRLSVLVVFAAVVGQRDFFVLT